MSGSVIMSERPALRERAPTAGEDRHQVQTDQHPVSDLAPAAGRDGLFADLPADELERLESRLRPVSCQAGTVLLKQGAWCGALYIVKSGVLSVDLELSDGTRRHLANLVSGDVVGEMSLLTGLPPSATVSAVVDAELWALEQADFMALLSTCPRLVRNISVLLSQRLARMNQGGPVGPARVMCLRLHPSCARRLPELIARAVAAHLATPLVVLDHRRGGDWLPAERLPALPSAIGNREVEAALASWQGPRVLATRTGEIDPETWVAARRWLGTHRAHVLVLAEHAYWTASNPALAHNIVADVALWPEAEQSAPTDAPDVALLTTQRCTNTRAELERASAHCGARVIRLVTLGGADEAAQIGWLARHLAGLKVGVALGAGGARGYALVGVLHRLHERGVPIDYISGCSIGALVAAAYASGMDTDTMLGHLDSAAGYVRRLTVPRRSFLSNRGLEQLYRGRLFGDTRLQDVPLPLAVVAADVLTGGEVVFERGLLWRALLASTAIPGIYPAVWVGDHCLVDGGVLDPVPIGAGRTLGADVVFGVKLGAVPDQALASIEATRPHGRKPPHVVDVLQRTFDIMNSEIATRPVARADVDVVVPSPQTSLKDFGRGRHLTSVGALALDGVWEQIGAVLPWLRAGGRGAAQGQTYIA